jgi:hypothetical protein
MKCTLFGDEDDENLVFVMGWGNKAEHETARWLIDKFVDAGYYVHAIEIPTVVTDFREEYVEPIQRYVDDLAEFRLLGHSTGGLIGPYIDGATTRTYLSPWWGFSGDGSPAMSLAMKLPTDRPILPAGIEKEGLGIHTTDRQIEEIPQRAAPTFLREAAWGQDHRPPIDEEAVVFCSLRDEVVGVRAIGRAVPSERTVIYDGGHELFGSQSRDEHLDTLLAVVRSGAEALAQ